MLHISSTNLSAIPQEKGARVTACPQSTEVMKELIRQGYWAETWTPACTVMRRDSPSRFSFVEIES
jgi:hypothetical protein